MEHPLRSLQLIANPIETSKTLCYRDELHWCVFRRLWKMLGTGAYQLVLFLVLVGLRFVTFCTGSLQKKICESRCGRLLADLAPQN